MLCTVVCCQNDCNGLGVSAVPQTKAVDLAALLLIIKSGLGLSCPVSVVVCHSIPTSEGILVAM